MWCVTHEVTAGKLESRLARSRHSRILLQGSSHDWAEVEAVEFISKG